jgi:hypothetical protein
MTNRDVAFDGLLAKLTTLSSRRGLASRDVRNLADGFCRLDGPLTKILLAREDVKIDPTDMTLINDELAALRETTHCAVKELEAGCSQAETKTWVVFLKVSFIKALLCAEKLYVLVDSVLKYRRPGWERLVVFVGDNESHQDDTGLLTLV